VLINRQNQLDTLCEELRAAWQEHRAPLAIDTEFISERRYWPLLCLVQVCCEAPTGRIEALIDPFALDIEPLLKIVEDKSILKILHAGGQDLQIFAQRYDCAPHCFFDTQIAAAFLGYGHQIGYVDIVRRLTEAQLSKGSQFSDWSARPLSAQQQEYALNDVRYLTEIYRQLRRDLENQGRLNWAQTEFRRAEEKAAQTTPPEELYLRLKTTGFNRRQLGILRALTIARDEVARELDKPPASIIPDPPLLQMVKQPPRNINEMRSARGVNVRNQEAQRLMDALQRAQSTPESQLPSIRTGRRLPPDFDAVLGVLSSVAGLRADENSISRSYLAPREELGDLIIWWLSKSEEPPPEISLLTDWRRALLGDELMKLLEGKLALKLDTRGPSAVRVVKLKDE
jgi:ribonuclease D